MQILMIYSSRRNRADVCNRLKLFFFTVSRICTDPNQGQKGSSKLPGGIRHARSVCPTHNPQRRAGMERIKVKL
jgi:hypothetical protein